MILQPHPEMPEIETYLMIIATAIVGAMSAIIASTSPEIAIAATAGMEAMSNGTVVIFEDFKLRGWCIAGACGGALVSILVFPLPKPRALAFKLVASGISGMMFSPMIIRWSGLQVDVDTVVFVSGIVALLSWGCIQIAVPVATKIFGKEIERRFKGVNGEDIQPKP